MDRNVSGARLRLEGMRREALHVRINGNPAHVICLCGSTRFKTEYQHENLRLTLCGNVVLTVAAFGHADNIPFDPVSKATLDAVHLLKIDLADEVRIINVGGYIGESTRHEIEYARACGKIITYLEEPATGAERARERSERSKG